MENFRDYACTGLAEILRGGSLFIAEKNRAGLTSPSRLLNHRDTWIVLVEFRRGGNVFKTAARELYKNRVPRKCATLESCSSILSNGNRERKTEGKRDRGFPSGSNNRVPRASRFTHAIDEWYREER